MIPIATGSGGAIAGALGGAAVGAAVTGGVGAPVGFVIGAVVGGTAGASAGIAATNNSKFDRAMVKSSKSPSSRCCSCDLYLDCFNGTPICCPGCQRLFCTNVSRKSSNSHYLNLNFLFSLVCS